MKIDFEIKGIIDSEQLEHLLKVMSLSDKANMITKGAENNDGKN